MESYGRGGFPEGTLSQPNGLVTAKELSPLSPNMIYKVSTWLPQPESISRSVSQTVGSWSEVLMV